MMTGWRLLRSVSPPLPSRSPSSTGSALLTCSGVRRRDEVPRCAVGYGADSAGISKVDCDHGVVLAPVQDSEDVGDDQGAGERPDEGCADGDPDDVQHAAAGGGRLSASINLPGNFGLVG